MHPGLTSREAAPRALRKKRSPFYREIPISGKMPIFLKNFSPILGENDHVKWTLQNKTF